MANSADPDQLASETVLQKPTDLDLSSLQRQGISGFSRTRVKIHPLNNLGMKVRESCISRETAIHSPVQVIHIDIVNIYL